LTELVKQVVDEVPVFENKGTKYLINWPAYKLTAEISRISANHESTKCLILFTTCHKDYNPHILQARLNLEATRSRTELAKELASRYKIEIPIDWKALTEYLVVKTLREYERGEPVIELSSEDEVSPLEYLIHPIAPLLKPTVIFGEPGAGKSQLAVIFSIVMCLPWRDNPLRLVPPKAPVTTLFLDYEADPEDVRRQLVSLAHGMKLPYIPLHYRRCSLPLADDVDSIINHAEDIKAKCLIVDSVSLAAGDDPSKPGVATEYFRKLRQTHLTSISLAHTSKDKEVRTKTIFGSVMWEAGARSVWEIQGQEDENALDVALFHRKANLSKKFSPQGYRIIYQNDQPSKVEWHSPEEVAEFVDKMPTTSRILDALKEGEQSMDALCESLIIGKTLCKVSLHRLKNKGLVTKLSDGNWGLAVRD